MIIFYILPLLLFQYLYSQMSIGKIIVDLDSAKTKL